MTRWYGTRSAPSVVIRRCDDDFVIAHMLAQTVHAPRLERSTVSTTLQCPRGAWLRRWYKDTAGANIVEAALITPLLLLLTFSIIDFASLFYVYMALENGVSQAARYGVTGNSRTGMSHEASIIAAMRDATPTLTIGNDAFVFTHMRPGSAVWEAGAGDPTDISRVAVTYPWSIMTPLVSRLFPGGEIVIRVESAMLNEPRFE